ncbi:exonuclease subunit SbcD [Oceanisphaera arctica]|uniref:Nuclease SbcCD subunit D n=1 Tax=Oceanisphaera arctica TaxID=641510 RepID=A0A2P5TNV9_9GAMM|nr:exonuclease subunit SbcD [Oceanisphaera arctica]PPL17271.1 exonuclease subunit SbcD [Oceanisphaera arctica]GHA20103.1 nuclease SbcCD subunit D [Oceanisphaera arctica]
MRILHTSDWHLGQHFMGKTRLDEHKAFLRWLVEQVKEHEVAAVLVAGDVFDTGTPPSYARELYNGFIVELQQTGAQLVILGGNHDSVAMLNESRRLLGCLNVQVIPGMLDDADHQVLVLSDRDGQPGAVLCAVPFIRAREVMASEAGQSAADKQQALQQAIADHYQQLFERAEQQRQQLGLPLPIIATGHLTTVGASSSDSVREIYIGTLDAFPASAFPPADYIALGHIHRPQKVGGHEHIRYCGSPIPLSFDEVGQQKEVLLVEVSGEGLQTVTPLPVPTFQTLARVGGNLEELAVAMKAVAADHEVPVWLEVTVSEDDYLSDLQPRVEQLAEGLPLEILLVRRQRAQNGNGLTAEQGVTLSELTPVEVFERRLAPEPLEAERQQALSELYRQLLVQMEEEA